MSPTDLRSLLMSVRQNILSSSAETLISRCLLLIRLYCQFLVLDLSSKLSLYTLYRHVRGAGVVAPLILNLETRWKWAVSFFRPGRFTPGERVPGTHWPTGCRPGKHHGRLKAFEKRKKKKKTFALLVFKARFLAYPSRSLITIATELSIAPLLILPYQIWVLKCLRSINL